MSMIEIEANELVPGMVLACPGDPEVRTVHTVLHQQCRDVQIFCSDGSGMSFGPKSRAPVQAESVWLHGRLRRDLQFWATPHNVPPGTLLEDEAGLLRRVTAPCASDAPSSGYVTITTPDGPFVLDASRAYKCVVTEYVRFELRESAKVARFHMHYSSQSRFPAILRGQEQSIEAYELRIGDKFYVGEAAHEVVDIYESSDGWMTLNFATDQRPWRLHKTDLAIIKPRTSAQNAQIERNWPSADGMQSIRLTISKLRKSAQVEDASTAVTLYKIACTCASSSTQHAPTCPVSPRPGLHGGLCTHPRSFRGHSWRWNAGSGRGEYRHPYAPAVDSHDLTYTARHGACSPLGELILQCFFEPPAQATDASTALNWDPYPGDDAELEIIASRRS